MINAKNMPVENVGIRSDKMLIFNLLQIGFVLSEMGQTTDDSGSDL